MHVPLHDFKSFRLVLILALTWWKRPWKGAPVTRVSIAVGTSVLQRGWNMWKGHCLSLARRLQRRECSSSTQAEAGRGRQPRRGKLPQGQPGSPCEVKCTSPSPQTPPQPWYLWGSGCKTTSHLKLRLLPNSSSLWQRGSTWARVLPPLTCLRPPASTCPDLSAVCQGTKWGLCSRSWAFGAGLGTQELSECCLFSSSFLNCSWSLQRALHQKHLHLFHYQGPSDPGFVPGTGCTWAVVLFTAVLCLSFT